MILNNKALQIVFIILGLLGLAMCYLVWSEAKTAQQLKAELNASGMEAKATVDALLKEFNPSLYKGSNNNFKKKYDYAMRVSYFNADKPIDFHVSFSDYLDENKSTTQPETEKERGESSYEVVHFPISITEYNQFKKGDEIPIKYIYGKPDSATRLDENGELMLPNTGWVVYLIGFLSVASLILAYFYGRGMKI